MDSPIDDSRLPKPPPGNRRGPHDAPKNLTPLSDRSLVLFLDLLSPALQLLRRSHAAVAEGCHRPAWHMIHSPPDQYMGMPPK
jgi:hypothetical protein